MASTDVPTIKLADGRAIPQVGLGFWKVQDKAEFKRSFDAGLAAGYRHFDTAQVYGNEQYLGEFLEQSEVSRRDVWITTKIAVQHFGHNHALKSFETSLANLKTDYVDLLLLHFPVSLLRRKTWKALEELQSAGKARSIGVSNYTIKHLEEMRTYTDVMPVVNQVELHVFLQQPELLAYCKQHAIVVEAYSPLAHGRAMDEPVIAELAKKYNKSYAQIMLRWCIERGLVILPKSVTPERVESNIQLFDFRLSDEDMDRLQKVERNLRTCWDPTLVP